MSKTKVWGIGLGRTGTRSLCEALRVLGYKNLRHVPPFMESLDNVDAAAEGICMSHFKYLDARFPNSKFVLTTRDLNSWLDSCRRAMETYRLDRIPPDSPFYDPMIRNRMARYGSLEYDESKLIERYYSHHFEVVSYFRDQTEKLLILNVLDDNVWTQLCGFLGLDRPDVEFPHTTSGLGYSDGVFFE